MDAGLGDLDNKIFDHFVGRAAREFVSAAFYQNAQTK